MELLLRVVVDPMITSWHWNLIPMPQFDFLFPFPRHPLIFFYQEAILIEVGRGSPRWETPWEDGGSSIGSQSYPSLTFDGAEPSLYGVATTGCIAMVGLLTGPQSPRSISAVLDAAGATATSHAAINIRPAA